MKKTPAYIAAHIRRVLINGASAPHTAEVEWFFKEEIKSRGWYTNELRKVAVRFRRSLLNEVGQDFLLAVADRLFRGRVLEEKVFAVLMLQGITGQFGDAEFKLFCSWLDRISTWADHDGLVSYLIGPMITAEPRRSKIVFQWAKSKDRWHRRAAAVALIRAIREQKCRPEVVKVTSMLLTDKDDMVQKGLGWLLREAAKYDREHTLPLLMKIRAKAPRMVLRTACETLPPNLKQQILVAPASSPAVARASRPRR
ncbi:MAG TPA: DNA alkylation repair protein [Terriglobales bacterium]|nr:DNA alkylation repair protein [Terriglobales bacterium]